MESVARVARLTGASLSRISRAVWSARGELGAVAALLAGWTLVTAFLATFHAIGPRVWYASGGLFYLACFGFEALGRMAWKGLYFLTHRKDGDA